MRRLDSGTKRIVGVPASSRGEESGRGPNLPTLENAIRVQFEFTGSIGQFDFFNFVLTLVSGSVIYGWGTVIVEKVGKKLVPGLKTIVDGGHASPILLDAQDKLDEELDARCRERAEKEQGASSRKLAEPETIAISMTNLAGPVPVDPESVPS